MCVYIGQVKGNISKNSIIEHRDKKGKTHTEKHNGNKMQNKSHEKTLNKNVKAREFLI